ncbi:PIN domain-containing protein [Nubsella zeaxanthinifaciens]|uniref:PIN domain-containing protein n=1 Tax=Nubsella zeaxanthinifaciens TaxID=392412 RepID=UPI003D048D87
MTAIFVDTNIFLHYRFFVDIPWAKLYGKDFQLVLTLTVINELDKHKRNANPKIASRAKQVLSRINDLLKDPGQFPIKHFNQRPSADIFEQNQLDRQAQDDCILATIISYQSVYPDHEVLFVSNDTGPRLRAAHLQIKADELPENLQNPNEASEEQKQIKQLKKELDLLKNAMPKLSLNFADGSSLLKANFTNALVTKTDYINETYQKLTAELSFLEFDDPIYKNEKIMKLLEETKNEWQKDSLVWYYDPSCSRHLVNQGIEKYNKALRQYEDKLNDYFEAQYEIEDMKSRMLKIDLKIENFGNAPANDLELWLTFPDHISLAYEDGLPLLSKMPTPPQKPIHNFDAYAHKQNILPKLWDGRKYSPQIENVEKRELVAIASSVLHHRYEALKHYKSSKLESYYVIFDSFKDIKNFKVEYKILANNIPEPINGSLSMVTTME